MQGEKKERGGESLNRGKKTRKPPSASPKGALMKLKLFFLAAGAALGSLERVDFGLGRRRGFNMGGHIADPVLPFYGRVRGRAAIRGVIEMDDAAAPVALFDDFVADPAVEGAPLGGHEGTIGPFSYSVAKHGKNLSFRNFKSNNKKKAGRA